jgi:hypothetical protein
VYWLWPSWLPNGEYHSLGWGADAKKAGIRMHHVPVICMVGEGIEPRHEEVRSIQQAAVMVVITQTQWRIQVLEGWCQT